MSTAQAPAGRGGSGPPPEATSFVGRHRELAEARRQLFLGRLITFNGPAGVGKSRLALRLARKVRRAFPDGVCLVDLADLQDPGLLRQAVAGALGISTTAEDFADRLLEAIRSARMLLVLDHCDHVLEAAARFVRDLLSTSDGPRVIVTSRQALGLPAERVLRVEPLAVPAPGATPESAYDVFSDAVRLFVDRAAVVRPGFRLDEDNRDTVVRICRRVDGMPLAIELAAARLRECDPEELLGRLDDRFGVLSGGAASTRHEALAESIGWSFELCTPDEQRLWRRLSCFSGEFDLPAAEGVCGEPPLRRDRIAELLAVLVDKSVVQREEVGGRAFFRMFDSIRDYGAYRLRTAGRQDVLRERHAEYFRGFATEYLQEQFGPDQLAWIHRAKRMHPNMRQVLEQELSHPDPAHARAGLRTAVRLWPFWYAANALREGRMWLERGLERVPEPCALRADGLAACAYLTLYLYRVDEAQQMLVEAQEPAESHGDSAQQARVTGVRGAAALFAGEHARAAELLEQAAAGHQVSAAPYGYINAMLLLTSVRFLIGDPRGEGAATEVLQLAERNGATWTKCYALWCVALYRWRYGDHREAALLLQQAIRLQRSIQDVIGLSFCLELLSWCTAAADQPHRTAHLAGSAGALRDLSGGRMGNAPYFERADDWSTAWARQVLGPEVFERTYREGARWSIEEMIAYALEESVASSETGR